MVTYNGCFDRVAQLFTLKQTVNTSIVHSNTLRTSVNKTDVLLVEDCNHRNITVS